MIVNRRPIISRTRTAVTRITPRIDVQAIRSEVNETRWFVDTLRYNESRDSVQSRQQTSPRKLPRQLIIKP